MDITVDGCDYEVEHTEASLGNPEWVVVWSKTKDLVGDAAIDHNIESIVIAYRDNPDNASYNYHELQVLKELHGIEGGVKELARWIVSTSC